MNRFQKFGAAALALSPLSAFAAAPDVTAVTTAITDAGTSIATVGAAVLALLVGVKVYKWIRRAM